MRKVLIGIQARTDSTRLKGKAHLTIEGKTTLELVVDSCMNVCRYMKKDRDTLGAVVSYSLLVPRKDPIAALYQNRFPLLEGSHGDVLSRFVMATNHYDCDYITRITADCVHIPTHIIAKHIKSALIKQRDYTTNTIIRTFKEGMDVQIFSRRLINWLSENVKTDEDKEHVGTLLTKVAFPFKDAENRPNICHVLSDYYEPEVKTSIDTQEDLELSRERFRKLKEAKNLAKKCGVYVT